MSKSVQADTKHEMQQYTLKFKGHTRFMASCSAGVTLMAWGISLLKNCQWACNKIWRNGIKLGS